MNKTKFWSLICAVLIMHGAVMAANVWWRGTTNTSSKTAANFSPAAIPTSVDTLRFTGDSAAAAFVMDTVLSVHRILADATFDENFKQSGYRITTVAGASFAAAATSDTLSLDSAFFVTGDGDFVFGAGPTYDAAALLSFGLELQGTGSLANNTGATRTLLKVSGAAAGKTTTHNGSADIYLRCWTLGAGTWTNSRRLDVNQLASGDVSFDAAHTIGGAGAITISCGVAASVDDTFHIPRINASTFTGTFNIRNNTANSVTIFLDGSLALGGQLYLLKQGTGATIFNTNDSSIAVADLLVLGNTSATNGITYNFGASVTDVNGTVQSTTFNTGKSIINLETSTTNAAGNVTFGSNTKINPGTSTLNFDGASGTQVFKAATPDSQKVYDFAATGAAAVTDSTVGGIQVLGDFSRTGDGATNLWYGIDCDGDVMIDGTGIPTIADTVKMTGASSEFHVGSTVGTPAMTGMTLYVDGNNSVIDFDKAATKKQLVIGAACTVTTSGAALSVYSGTGSPLVFVDGGKLNISIATFFRPTASVPIISYLSGVPSYSILAGATLALQNSGAINSTIPAMTITPTGTGIANLQIGASSAVVSSIGLAGDIDFTADGVSLSTINMAISQSNSNTSIRTNGYDLSCNTLNSGSNSATTVSSLYLGAGTEVAVNVFNQTPGNTGTTDVYDTASWTVGTNFSWQSTHNHFPASGQSLTMTGTGTLTTAAGKYSPDSLRITGTVTLADSLSARAINLASGTLNITDRAVRATNFIINSAATLTSNATSRIWMAANGILRMGTKSLPLVRALGDLTIFDGGTLAGLPLTDGSTYTWPAGQTVTITSLADADWTGASPTTTKFVSGTPGTQYTIAIPNALTLAWMEPTDCAITGFEITVDDGTSIDGGNNTGWIFPAVVKKAINAMNARLNAYRDARRSAYRP